MSLIIKSEPNSVVELSSDDEVTVANLSNGIPNTELIVRPSTPDTQCSICLDDLTNKCYSNACWHLFCFECLKRWSNSEPTCPLCKKNFHTIYHSFDDLGAHKTYNVTTLARIQTPRVFVQPFVDMSSDIDRMFRMNMFLDIVRRNDRRLNNITERDLDGLDFNHNEMDQFYDSMNHYPRPTLQRPIIGQAMRIRVYADDLWSLPLADVTGRFRECSTAFYRDNPGQTYRLHSFILRDLVAIREASRRDGEAMPVPLDTDVSVTNLIMRSLAAYEIRLLHVVGVLQPFLHGFAVHFCHELYTYANSPYDINGFDRHVNFSYPPHDSELTTPIYDLPLPPIHVLGDTIVLDSDEEDIRRPITSIIDVIELSSSANDSDVEILSPSFRSIDQPSTSTGIRNSLDRPHNRYNLRRRRIFPPALDDSNSFPIHNVYGLSRMSYPTSLSRWMTNLDSSSDDEESTTTSQGSQTAHRKTRNVKQNEKNKKKAKKNKYKKRKISTNDSQSEIRSTNRSRTYSGSSSSSGDTDLRPNNSSIPNTVL